MTLSQLRIFVCASRHLNLSGAANELGMSQPAVSLQMKKLQDELGIELYRTSNRGIELTSKGWTFVSDVQPLIEKLGRIESQYKTSAKEARANFLTIGATYTLTETVLLEKLAAFRAKHSDVRVILEAGASPKIEKGVRTGQIDIGLISGPSYFSDCGYEELGEQEIVAFVPYDHPLSGKAMSLAQLMQQPLVTKKDGTYTKRLLRMGLNPNIVLECGGSESIMAAVTKGLGVGVLFRARIKPDIDKKEFGLIRVSELRKLTRKSFIVFSRSKSMSKAGRAFLSSLRKRG